MATEQTSSDAELWASYLAGRSDAARNQLCIAYRPLVVKIATKLHDRLPREVQFDDIFQCGSIGLIAAVRTFDPAFRVKFVTYASRRIYGEMIDGLRAVATESRGALQLRKRVAIAEEAMTAELGRRPLADEIGARCGSDARRLAERPAVAYAVSLDSESDDDGPQSESIADYRERDPSEIAVAADILDYVARNLSLRQAIALRFHFIEGWSFPRIAAELFGISESRVRQLYNGTLEHLRSLAA